MKHNSFKVVWLIVIICVVLLSGLAYAQFKPGSEPDGFRGIEWGQDVSTVKDLIYVTTDSSFGGVDLYGRKDDELKMGGAKLEVIFYYFWKDKLSAVCIVTDGEMNWEYFKAIIFEKFGIGYQDNKFIEYYTWVGDKTLMSLEYDEVSERGVLWMFSAQMAALQKEWEKEQIKKGVEEGW